MKTLFTLFVENVRKNADKEAVVHNNKRVSYGELFERIKKVAYQLKSLDLKKGDRIAIYMNNSVEYVVCYYATIAVGCVAVPLNSSAKARDVINWVKHSGANLLFLSDKSNEFDVIIEKIPDINIVIIGNSVNTNNKNTKKYYYEQFLEKNITENDEKIEEDCQDANQVASIIYTSGTTGDPKGVTLSHNNLTSNVKSIIEYLQLTDNDKVLNILPFYYSYGNSVLHTHLVIGATLVLENNMLYPHKVLQLMQDEKVTGFYGVPSTYSLLISRTNFTEYNLSALRYLAQAGGAMAPSNIKIIIDNFPNINFFVMYGQTEATARLSYLPPKQLQRKMGSIGIAIPGTTLEIRNSKGKKINVGEVGEIYAKGPNIMQGYWNNPQATENTIIDGWLKTGDLATYDNDGYIYIKGRSSEMIKTGANRVSPKEIEEVISEVRNVEEVAVVGMPDNTLGEIIVAYIVLSPGKKLDNITILSHCRKNLANYKVPKRIEYIDELPKTASGKVKKFILSQMLESAHM